MLKDERAIRPWAAHDLAADAHTPLRWKIEPGSHSQERRLTAPRRTDDRNEFTIADCEVDRIEGDDRASALIENTADALENDVAQSLLFAKARSLGSFCTICMY